MTLVAGESSRATLVDRADVEAKTRAGETARKVRVHAGRVFEMSFLETRHHAGQWWAHSRRWMVGFSWSYEVIPLCC